MIENATGLILRTRPLTETSLIVHWLTPNLGRIATVAKGARRPKSPFRGKLDLFYFADLSFSRSRRSDLHNLREVALRDTHARLRQDLSYLRQASYTAALIEQTTEAETPLPAVFDLMRTFLDQLGSQPPNSQTLFAFELKLLHELGLNPNLAQSRLTPGAKEVIRNLLEGDWALTSRLKLTAPQATELRQFLHAFLVFHAGKVPAARTAALQV
jgi:DNA repair protein RecO (recombination protein O)